MSRRRSLRAALVTLVLALATAGAAWSAEPGAAPPAGIRHAHWQARFQQRLGLTDDQMQQIRQIYQRDAEARRQHFRALREARAELRRLVLDGADQAAIEGKQTEVQQLLAQSVEMRVRLLKEISPILTPEQREKLAQMRPWGRRHHRRPAQS